MTRFTITEAARAEGIRLFDLVKAVQQGKLEFEQEGGIIYISQASLDSYLGKGAAAPVATAEEVPPVAPVFPAQDAAIQDTAVQDAAAPLPEAPIPTTLDPTSLDQIVETPIATAELLPTLELPIIKPSEPEQPLAAPKTKTIVDRMSDVYGLRLPYFLQEHDESTLRTLVINIGGAVGDAWLKTILRQGRGEDLFRLGTEQVQAYSRKLLEVKTLIHSRFPETIPARYDVGRVPSNFLPVEIEHTHTKLLKEIDQIVRNELEERDEEERRATTAREMPHFRDIAMLVLEEDGYEKLKQEFPEDKVALTAAVLYDAIGEESTKILLGSDFYRNILRIGPAGLENYVQNLKAAQQAITATYGDEVPEEYDLHYFPTRFAPDKIAATIKKIERAGNTPDNADQHLYTIEEICARTTLPRDLVQGLISEGHDVYVLEAMLKEGFDLTAPSPLIGGRDVTRKHWESNANRAYVSLGVPSNQATWKKSEKQFRGIGLIEKTARKNECYSMNSSWASVTKDYPSLKQYLAHYLAPKKKE